MKEGLLWYDDNPNRDLAEKIGRAARRYRQKYNASPNICYVHPSALLPAQAGNDNGKTNIPNLRVVTRKTVLRHHFWVGVETERSPQ